MLEIIILIVNTGLIAFLLFRVLNQNKDQSRTESLLSKISDSASFQKGQLDTFQKQLATLIQMNEQKLEKVREVVESNLQSLQNDNTKQLEKMRETVDEKLQSTLEKRLGESFKLVSERLEKVHEGLGEMQTLALGVGDLKKVLSNVKTKGNLGELQLGAVLDQVLSPEQYYHNIITKSEGQDSVEYAIKLPGVNGKEVLLPIDSKFPTVNYEKLLDAQDKVDKNLVEEAEKALDAQIKLEAKKIRDKYIDPPNTTDFGILFLPFEGLYAEVLRRPGLFEQLRREFKVTIVGPTTIVALLNSLQMGFRTLAVQKRASEVWDVLGAVKAEFGKFGTILDATKKRLDRASKEIDNASRRSRAIERNLRDVQELPSHKKSNLLEVDEIDEEDINDYVEEDIEDDVS